MPLIPEGEALPAWSDIDRIAIIRGGDGTRTTVGHRGRQKLVVALGAIRVLGVAAEIGRLAAGGTLDLPGGSSRTIVFIEPGIAVWVAGRWTDPTGGSGVFKVARTTNPVVRGDAITYAKETDFDNHYHDCDEYWIIVDGRGTAVTEGVAYEIGPGDTVATRWGEHHDLPLVEATVTGVYLETTLHGAARRGHLWAHTHGPAAVMEPE